VVLVSAAIWMTFVSLAQANTRADTRYQAALAREAATPPEDDTSSTGGGGGSGGGESGEGGSSGGTTEEQTVDEEEYQQLQDELMTEDGFINALLGSVGDTPTDDSDPNSITMFDFNLVITRLNSK